MCNIYKRIGALFCAVGVLLMFMAAFAFSSVAADSSGDATLTLICREDGDNIAGMTWRLYKVGKKQDGNYVPEGKFVDYPVDLSKIMESSDSMTEAASTLSNFALLDGITCYDADKTNNSGYLTFSGLESGLYLVVGAKIKVGSITYFPTPFLIETDGRSESTQNCYPKFLVKNTLPGATEKFILRKVWANADGLPDGKPNLTIGIYKDYELYETIQLTEADNWTYSWEGDPSSDWRVKELIIPSGCYVMYRNNETQYVIMNTFDNDLLIQQQQSSTTTTETTTTSTVSTTVSNSVTTTVQTIDEGSDTRTRPTSTIDTTVLPASSSTETTAQTIDEGSDTRTRPTSTSVTSVLPDGSSTATTFTTTVSGSGTVTNSSSTDSDVSTDSTISSDSTASTDSTESTETTTTGSNEITSTSTRGYVVTTRQSTYRTNSRVTTTTTIEKLPQTGQLWWPVPVMALGGLIFVAVGLRLLLDSRKED